jgi:hypothetical protein
MSSVGLALKLWQTPFGVMTGWNCEHRTWGRCYDHTFLIFLPIFGEKNGVFLKTNVMIKFWQKVSSSLSKNATFFAKTFFGENIFKILASDLIFGE